MPLQYLVALSVVVPAEGVESSHLHPATTQLLAGFVKESTDVSADLKRTEGMTAWHLARTYSIYIYVYITLNVKLSVLESCSDREKGDAPDTWRLKLKYYKGSSVYIYIYIS